MFFSKNQSNCRIFYRKNHIFFHFSKPKAQNHPHPPIFLPKFPTPPGESGWYDVNLLDKRWGGHTRRLFFGRHIAPRPPPRQGMTVQAFFLCRFCSPSPLNSLRLPQFAPLRQVSLQEARHFHFCDAAQRHTPNHYCLCNVKANRLRLRHTL